MKRVQRLAIAVVGLSLIWVCVVGLNRKWQQRVTILELLKQEHIAVQFTDGEYCESTEGIQKRNWLLDRVDVIYFDVQHGGTSKEFLPLMESLPSLSRVIIRYQGDDFEQFRMEQQGIQDKLAKESSCVEQAFPNLEVLSCWGVAQ